MGFAEFGVKVFDGYVAPTFATLGSFIPASAKNVVVLTLGSKDMRADGVKTYLGRTGDLLLTYMNYTQNDSKALINLGIYGSAIKATLSAIEVITKFPEMCQALATKTNQVSSYTRTRERNEGFEIVSDRLSKVWFWFIGVADAISFVNKVKPDVVPGFLNQAKPWIYVVAGTGVAAHFIQQELKVLKMLKDDETAEKVNSYINLATSATYVFSSAVLAVSQISKAESLKKWSFYASVGTGVMPVVQRLYGSYVLHFAKTKST